MGSRILISALAVLAVFGECAAANAQGMNRQPPVARAAKKVVQRPPEPTRAARTSNGGKTPSPRKTRGPVQLASTKESEENSIVSKKNVAPNNVAPNKVAPQSVQ